MRSDSNPATRTAMRRVRMRGLALLTFLLLAALALAACGDGNGGAGSGSEPRLQAAIAQGRGQGGLLIIDLPSGDQRRVNIDLITGPVWAPGGDRLLVRATVLDGEDASPAHLILDREGAEVARRPFTVSPGRPGIQPAWSSDGAAVAVGGDEILLLEADGDLIVSAPWPRDGDSVLPGAWSPDDRRYVTAGHTELVVLDRDGGAIRVALGALDLTSGRFDLPPVWDGDVVTLRAQFVHTPGDEPDSAEADDIADFFAYEVDIDAGEVVGQRQETFAERRESIEQAGLVLPGAVVDEAIASRRPENAVSAGIGFINGLEGRWEVFVDSRDRPSQATLVYAWRDLAGAYELPVDTAQAWRPGAMDLVGIPGDSHE